MVLLEEFKPEVLVKGLLPGNLAKHFPFARFAIIEAPKVHFIIKMRDPPRQGANYETSQ